MSQADLQTQPPPSLDAPSAPPSIIQTTFKILTFRATSEDFDSLSSQHLLFGLLCTWVVGMGRWWDDPTANPLQRTGLGSVVYVFFLSVLLWILANPIAPKRIRFLQLLTFVTLTAPPAILYAIPVEMLTGNQTALNLNIAFLIIVALWRVALYWRFLRVGAQMNRLKAYIALSAPISLLLLLLTWLGLMHLTLKHMGGLRAIQTVNGTETEIYLRPPPDEPDQTIVHLLVTFGVPLALLSLVLWLGFSIYSNRNAFATPPSTPPRPPL